MKDDGFQEALSMYYLGNISEILKYFNCTEVVKSLNLTDCTFYNWKYYIDEESNKSITVLQSKNTTSEMYNFKIFKSMYSKDNYLLVFVEDGECDMQAIILDSRLCCVNS